MHEAAVAQIDSDVRCAGRVCLEKDKVARFEPARDVRQRGELVVCSTWQLLPELGEDVLHESGAVEARRRGASPHERRSQEMQRRSCKRIARAFTMPNQGVVEVHGKRTLNVPRVDVRVDRRPYDETVAAGEVAVNDLNVVSRRCHRQQ